MPNRDFLGAQSPAGEPARVLTVTTLNQRARQLLETQFAQVRVAGEISNLACPSSGHWYFTLKDAKAQIRCAMFRNRNQRLRLRPENGMQVMLRGRLSLYEARGDYQLIAEHLEEAGVGDLQRAFEQLKQTLAGRGWFGAERKQALPALPRHIGVVTSPDGAALHDILTVLQRRFPATGVTVLATAVQGNTAAPGIAAALALANRMGPDLEPPLDALIVARGGGSLEDLWAFNEEVVAAAIVASQLPVVSAVGHETDFTIADFVADQRAPTPSAAAELLSPDQQQWRQALARQQQQLSIALQQTLQQQQQRLNHLHQRLKHPGTRLRESSQRLDDAELRLRRAFNSIHLRLETQLNNLQHRLSRRSPVTQIGSLTAQLSQHQAQLERAMTGLLRAQQARLHQQAELLDSVSPLNTLKRGYAIVQNEHGTLIRDSDQLKKDDTIQLRLGQGKLAAKVL